MYPPPFVEIVRTRSTDMMRKILRSFLDTPDATRELQSFLLDPADGSNMPMIANWTIEDTVRVILLEVNYRISEHYPPDPCILE